MDVGYSVFRDVRSRIGVERVIRINEEVRGFG